MTSIAVWNAREIREKREEIIKHIRDYDIFAITESRYKIIMYSTFQDIQWFD